MVQKNDFDKKLEVVHSRLQVGPSVCVCVCHLEVSNFERGFLDNGWEFWADILNGKRAYAEESKICFFRRLLPIPLGLGSGGEGAIAPSTPRHPPYPRYAASLPVSLR